MCDVVGPGFVSTSPAFMRGSTSHPAAGMADLPKKTVNRDLHYWWREVLTEFAQQFVSAVTAPPRVGCVVLSLHQTSHAPFSDTSQNTSKHAMLTLDSEPANSKLVYHKEAYYHPHY